MCGNIATSPPPIKASVSGNPQSLPNFCIFFFQFPFRSNSLLSAIIGNINFPSESRVTDPSTLLNCLQWKFTTSDTNGDGVLSGRELYPTLRAVRRHYGDKRCLRKVIKFCDSNKDRKVTMKEWISCMKTTQGELKAR